MTVSFESEPRSIVIDILDDNLERINLCERALLAVRCRDCRFNYCVLLVVERLGQLELETADFKLCELKCAVLDCSGDFLPAIVLISNEYDRHEPEI